MNIDVIMAMKTVYKRNEYNVCSSKGNSAMPYTIWECLVCGLLYDEAKGWPDDNIPPGTRWENVPDDWECPDCGVGKEDFEMVEVDASNSCESSADNSTLPVVIIGTGLAGYNLAREFRSHDIDTPILMITKDDGRFYSKPILSTGFSKNRSADQIATASAKTMEINLKATILTHTCVTSIDPIARMLRIEGRDLYYSKLVLASGASSVAAPLTGNGLQRVYSVNSLAEYQTFRDAMQGKTNILIIGAGLIGSEYANDMITSGFNVDAVEPMTTVLPTLMPEEASYALQRCLARAGVRYHFNTKVERVDLQGAGIVATLANGNQIEADAVLCSIGVRPNLTLATQAGLATNRGIMTDRSLKTSAPNVYAVGDCAEVDGHLLYYVAPLNASAKVLARVLAGQTAKVQYEVMPVVVKTSLCPVVVNPPQHGARGNWQVKVTGDDVCAHFMAPSGKQLGFALTGNATKQRKALTVKNQWLMP